MKTVSIPSPAALIPSKSSWTFGLKILAWVLFFALVVFIIYWVVYLRGINWTTIKSLISQEAAKYPGNEANVEHILMDGVKHITGTPHLNAQARSFAKDSKLPLEQVLVDNAIAMAQMAQYIKQAA